MVDGMQLFKMGFSWGGFESLLLPIHFSTANRSVTLHEARGQMLRLNIGLENVDDLIADLAAGLKRYRS
jgi:cysteine-S-conjugate beta-lyase